VDDFFIKTIHSVSSSDSAGDQEKQKIIAKYLKKEEN